MSDSLDSWSIPSPLGCAVGYCSDDMTCGGLPRHTHARRTSSSGARQRVTSGEPSDLDLSLCFLDAISLVRVRGLAMVWRTRADADGLWRALLQHRWPRYDISDNGGTIMKLYIDLLRRRRVAIAEEPGVFQPMDLGPVPRVCLRREEPPPTPEALYNGGYGLALYCGYYSSCPNDASERLLKCDVCEVACCVEWCLKDVLSVKVCRHCRQTWSDEAFLANCRRCM